MLDYDEAKRDFANMLAHLGGNRAEYPVHWRWYVRTLVELGDLPDAAHDWPFPENLMIIGTP